MNANRWTRRGFETRACLLARAWPDGSIVLLNPPWDLCDLIARWRSIGIGNYGFTDAISIVGDEVRTLLRSVVGPG
jgi:hypothetical protein